MNNNAHTSRFEVTSHFELPTRGGFVVGHIRAGAVHPGMWVDTHSDPATLRVVGVESLSNTAEKKYWNALVFAGHPTLAFVKAVFPIGSVIELRTDESAEVTTSSFVSTL